MSVALALLAMLTEAVVGYPDRLVRAIGHPVIWIGKLIAALERRLNRSGKEADTGASIPRKSAAPKSTPSPLEGEVGWRNHPGGGYADRVTTSLPDPPPRGGRERTAFTPFPAPSLTLPHKGGRERSDATREGEDDARVKPGNDKADGARAASRIPGVIALLVLLAVVGGTSLAVERALLMMPFGLIALALIASSLLAQRSLHQHVARVATALETGGIEGGRAAVSQIVGRDPASLDEAGVARAAIESLAENFSDGVVAPVFWLALGGLPGAAIYKATNTADSMIGHRTPRYENFGWAAARLDDLLNLPASRLTALLLIAAAALTSRKAAAQAWAAVWRDAAHHCSPNAGFPEAAMAGALSLKLAGPRVYSGARVDDAFMGDGRREATAADIRAALALYRRADALLIALVAVLSFAAWLWLHW